MDPLPPTNNIAKERTKISILKRVSPFLILMAIPLIAVAQPVNAPISKTTKIQHIHNQIFKPVLTPVFPKGEPMPKIVPKMPPRSPKRPRIEIKTPPTSQNVILDYARKQNAKMFGEKHWPALYQLWKEESGWRPTAINRSSGACGIAQLLPCRAFGSYQTQIDKGLLYIRDSVQGYKNPTNALIAKHQKGWY